MRIIHMGDVHLDSAFSGLNSDRAEVRRNELRATFTSVLTYAGMEKADMVIIAGDLFDVSYATRETMGILIREFSKLSCPVIITPGNHDPATSDSIWKKNIFPKNTYVFTDETVKSFDFPELNTTVYGWAFESQFMDGVKLSLDAPLDKSRINILCGHGDLTGSASRSCPVTARELADFGADYVALGHIHCPSEYGDGVMYCGCLEPRGFDEPGGHGIVDVTVEKEGENARVVARRVRFSKRRYEKNEIDITGADSNGDIGERIDKFVSEKGYGSDTLLRLTLRGTVSPEFVINKTNLERDNKRLFSLTVTDETSPLLTEKELENDPTLKGEFYRVLKPLLNSENPKERKTASDALRYGLAALAGESLSAEDGISVTDGEADGGAE